jgi:hypothetical protein
MWGAKYQVIVSTHLDKNHLHCHFAVNSVSFVDGLKYDRTNAEYARMRSVADRLCRERGLSVIENPQKTKTPRMIYLAEKNGEPTRYNLYRQAIDKAVACAMTRSQLPIVLQKMGYEIKMTGKYWSIKMAGDARTTRLYRLGEAYTNASITNRIYEGGLLKQRVPLDLPPKPTVRHAQLRGTFQTVKKLTGFRALYFHYLYLLGKLPVKQEKPRPPVHAIFYEDIRKMHIYSAQIKLIVRNKIDTLPQLQSFTDKTQSQMDELISQRTKIQNKLRRAKDPEVKADLLKQKTELTAQISACRKDLKLCDGIRENTERMKEKIRLYRETQQPPQKQQNKTRERGYRDAR